MIKYFRLPLVFDAAGMQEEAARLEQTYWKQHYNTQDYDGSWSVIPLRSFMGLPDALFSVHQSAGPHVKYLDTPLLEQCPVIRNVLQQMQCELQSVRLMNLGPGAIIKPHRDHDLHFEKGEARLHIPVQTAEEVSFYVEEERIPLREGECWYLNLSLTHRVENRSKNNRIHLVMDCLVNDWLEGMAERAVVKAELADTEPGEQSYTAAEKSLMIAQLTNMGTPAALEIAARLQST